MKKYKIKLDRRSFLKKSGMLGMASLAPGVMFKNLLTAEHLMNQHHQKIDGAF